jgi:hypothetical protein
MAIESTNDWEVKNYNHLESQYKDHTLIVFDLYNGDELRTHIDWDIPTELILNDPEEFERMYQTRINQAKSDWLMEQDNG